MHANNETEPRQELVDLTVALARIDSVNPTLVDGGAGEAEVAAFVAEWMQRQGWQVSTQDVTAGRPNVIGKIAGGNGPTLLVNGHLDTVGATQETKLVHVDGPNIWGRGVLDTKGGLAAALVAGAALDQPPPGDVLIAAVVDEEDAGIGTTALLDAGWTADGSVVLEPTDLRLGHRHRGFGIFEVVLQGRSAHTAHRDEGRNAIEAAFGMHARLSALDAEFSRRSESDPFNWPTIQVTQISGGQEVFTIPDECSATVEVRTVAGSAEHDLDAVAAAIVNDSTEGISIATDLILVRPPLGTDSGERIVGLVGQALGSLGYPAEPVILPFFTDAALQAEAGIPSVVFGPGGGGMHSDNEHVSIDDLVSCQAALCDVMARFGDL